MKRILCALSLAGLLGIVAEAAPVLLLTPPGGVTAGTPGSTVGFGFQITNLTDFLLVTGSSFTPSSPLVTYTDYIGTNFIVVGPAPESPNVSQPFSSTAHTGVGAFSILGSAPVGVSVNGTLTVNYAIFSRSPNDPLFDPDTDLVTADAAFSQPVTVNVAPEPGTWWMLGAAAPVVIAVRRRRTR